MSTFDGIVREFPTIRIDHFRSHPGKPPPAAYFLSHVHSDHLLGLESVKMPFVYCSATTRQMLLKMEKYPHRINYAKGILESRKQHYRHLRTVLRALPIQTATDLELGPKSTIRVTLIDANHCPGAVMFLIEGDGRAILYTGDIRAEPWWVNSIVQTPNLLPYTCGLKALDCIYLDTTFASHTEPYREFPTKAEGLKELLGKVSRCPPETVFYFRAWTLGYEDVWICLSNLLRSRVHVDEYQLRLLRPPEDREHAFYREAPSLTGFTVGNQSLEGCLTRDSDVRIHSCEPGMKCHVELKNLKNIKWITPIISRLQDGTEIREIGAGGGAGDLYQTPELRLDNLAALQQFGQFCAGVAENETVTSMIMEEVAGVHNMRTFVMMLEGLDVLDSDQNPTMTLTDFVQRLSEKNHWADASKQHPLLMKNGFAPDNDSNDTIHFPYSRHSSYHELRHLVEMFRPKDICPCTVDPEKWSEEVSMEALFGDLCSGKKFSFDKETRRSVEEFRDHLKLSNSGKRKRGDADSQQMETQDDMGDDNAFETAQMDAHEDVVDTAGTECCITSEKIAKQQQSNSISPGWEKQLKRIEASFLRANEARNDVTLEDSDDDAMSFSTLDDCLGEELTLSDKTRNAEGSGQEKGGHLDQDREEKKEARWFARREAYEAARLCLDRNDSGRWDDLDMRSVGRRGHEEKERML